MCAVLVAAPAFAKMKVFVTIAPQKYFVEQIVKDKAEVFVLVPAGASPHSYEPRPKQMTELAQSSIYFSINDPSEQAWLRKIKGVNKNLRVVATDKGIKKREMEEHHHHDEDEAEEEHGHEHHDHDHGMADPHIWLDPVLVMTQAKNIADGLAQADPANKNFYIANLNGFTNKLRALDLQIARTIQSSRNKKFMVFHPSWGYFADRYKLTQVSVEVEGKSPKPAELVKLIDTAKREKLKVIFAQPQFSKKEVETIAKETGAKVVMIDPLAADWEKNMLSVAKAIAGQ
jgi:zinc transport system substrate-binding protein